MTGGRALATLRVMLKKTKKTEKAEVKEPAVEEIKVEVNEKMCAGPCKREHIRFVAFNDGLKFCSTECYNAFYKVI